MIADAALAAFSDDEPGQTGAHDPNKTGFTLQQLELSLSASVDPYLRFDANIVFNLTGVEIEEAFATTLALPGNLQARAGQFLNRVGRINTVHPHGWTFLDQPLANGKILGAEGSRGLGLELSWLTPLPWFTELSGSAGSAAEAEHHEDGEDEAPIKRLDDLLYTLRLEQFFAIDDDWSILFGLSTQLGPNPTRLDARADVYASDLYVRYRPVRSADRMALALQVEGFLRSRHATDERRLNDGGGYAELSWRIDPNWETAARYEYVTGVAADAQWKRDRQRASVQLTYYPSHFSRVRVQGAWDDPKYRDEPIWAAMLGLEVLVGAHGAHEF